MPERFDPDAFDDEPDSAARASIATTAERDRADDDGPPVEVVTAELVDPESAQDLWDDVLAAYAAAEQSMIDLEETLGRFVDGRGWIALGYPSAPEMIKGMAAAGKLRNPQTGRELSPATVNRLSQWLELMERIAVTTGVPAAALDFPARALRAIPAGPGRMHHVALAGEVAERAAATAGGAEMSSAVVQSVLAQVLEEKGGVKISDHPRDEEPAGGRGGHGVRGGRDDDDDDLDDEDLDAELDGPGWSGPAGDGPRPMPGGAVQGSADNNDEADQGNDSESDGDGLTQELRDNAQTFLWWQEQMVHLERSATALAAVATLRKRTPELMDFAHDSELAVLRRRFGALPDLIDKVAQAKQVVRDGLIAAAERDGGPAE